MFKKKEEQEPAKPIEKPIDTNIKKYKPLEGPSNIQLGVGMWWIKNRGLLKKILIGSLILTSVLLWGYTIYGVFDYIYQGINDDKLMQQQLTGIRPIDHNIILNKSPQELVIDNISILPSSGGTYDIAAKIYNPNKTWHAAFDYNFIIGSNETEPQPEFILPEEKKYLVEFLYEGAKSASAAVKFNNLKWRRIDQRDTGNVAAYLKEATNIEVSDTILSSLTFSGQGEQVNTLIFTVKNNTPYNFWEVYFYFALRSGSRLLGVNKYMIEQVASGEAREASFTWLGRLPSSQVEVIPSVNIFDENNYKPFEFGAGQVK